MIQSPFVGPVAFHLGPLQIRWYGIFIACGLLAGLFVATKEALRRGLSRKVIEDLLLWCGIPAIIGARLYYAVLSWASFANNPVELVAIWHGGLAIHGAVIGGIFGFVLYVRHRKLKNIWGYLDCMILGLLTGQIIGRWGNFANQEAFGVPTSFPWGVYISPEHRPPQFSSFETFHPTFLYESVWNAITLAIVWHLNSRKLLKPGWTVALYCITYGTGRFWIEELRTDSLMFFGFRAAQLISVLLVVLGVILLIGRKKQLTSDR